MPESGATGPAACSSLEKGARFSVVYIQHCRHRNALTHTQKDVQRQLSEAINTVHFSQDSTIFSNYFKRRYFYTVKPIFQCDAKPFAFGTGIGLYP